MRHPADFVFADLALAHDGRLREVALCHEHRRWLSETHARFDGYELRATEAWTLPFWRPSRAALITASEFGAHLYRDNRALGRASPGDVAETVHSARVKELPVHLIPPK